MSILMGIMAALMVVGILSGHKHMMGVHDNVEQSLESQARVLIKGAFVMAVLLGWI